MPVRHDHENFWLEWLGYNRRFWDLKVFALKRTYVLCPGLLDQAERFLKAGSTLVAWHIKTLKMDRNLTPTDTEFQAPLT